MQTAGAPETAILPALCISTLNRSGIPGQCIPKDLKKAFK